jgi:hypothetical protein
MVNNQLVLIYNYTSKTAFWAGWFPADCAGLIFVVMMLGIWFDDAGFWKWPRKKSEYASVRAREARIHFC